MPALEENFLFIPRKKFIMKSISLLFYFFLLLLLPLIPPSLCHDNHLISILLSSLPSFFSLVFYFPLIHIFFPSFFSFFFLSLFFLAHQFPRPHITTMKKAQKLTSHTNYHKNTTINRCTIPQSRHHTSQLCADNDQDKR